MSCCRRPPPVPAPPTSTRGDGAVAATERRASSRSSGGLVLEYVGTSRLLVIGPATGRRYLFPQPGARLGVDIRDRASLLTVPSLRAIG